MGNKFEILKILGSMALLDACFLVIRPFIDLLMEKFGVLSIDANSRFIFALILIAISNPVYFYYASDKLELLKNINGK